MTLDRVPLRAGHWRATLSTGMEVEFTVFPGGKRWKLDVWRQGQPVPRLSGGGTTSEKDGWYMVALAVGAVPFDPTVGEATTQALGD